MSTVVWTFTYTEKATGAVKRGKIYAKAGASAHTAIAAVYGGVMDWSKGVADLVSRIIS